MSYIIYVFREYCIFILNFTSKYINHFIEAKLVKVINNTSFLYIEKIGFIIYQIKYHFLFLRCNNLWIIFRKEKSFLKKILLQRKSNLYTYYHIFEINFYIHGKKVKSKSDFRIALKSSAISFDFDNEIPEPHESASMHIESFDAACATDGCWPSLERRRAIWSQGKRERDGFENRVNGASYGGIAVVSLHVRIGARSCCCTCCRACAFLAFIFE